MTLTINGNSGAFNARIGTSFAIRLDARDYPINRAVQFDIVFTGNENRVVGTGWTFNTNAVGAGAVEFASTLALSPALRGVVNYQVRVYWTDFDGVAHTDTSNVVSINYTD